MSDIIDVEDEDFLQMGMLKLEIKRIRRKADEQSKGMQVQNPVAGMQQQPVVAMAQPVMVAAPQPQTMQAPLVPPAGHWSDWHSFLLCFWCGGIFWLCGLMAWHLNGEVRRLNLSGQLELAHKKATKRDLTAVVGVVSSLVFHNAARNHGYY